MLPSNPSLVGFADSSPYTGAPTAAAGLLNGKGPFGAPDLAGGFRFAIAAARECAARCILRLHALFIYLYSVLCILPSAFCIGHGICILRYAFFADGKNKRNWQKEEKYIKISKIGRGFAESARRAEEFFC